MIASAFAPLLSSVARLIGSVVTLAVAAVLVLAVYFCIRYKINPLRLRVGILRQLEIRWKWFDLARWILVDLLEREFSKNEFKPYGFTFFVGPQGTGKTVSMVHYLDQIKAKYPNCLIVTNFAYHQADHTMIDWQDIVNVRNGKDGVVFAIDEIQSEYSSAAWKDVPESLLSEISQQRKQRVKIVATAQFFTRVAKPLREQAATVVVCKTFFGRLTVNREYDALRYALVTDNPGVVRQKLKPSSKTSFVQSDQLRSEYDTFEKILRMRDRKFIPRHER